MTSAIQILRQMAAAEMKRKHTSYPENLTLPVKPYNDKTANGLTRCIIDFLKFSGWQAERINTTGRPVDRREIVTNVIGQKRQIGSVEWIRSGSTPGSADISATIKGRSVKIEVKCRATGDHYQSEAQIRYQQAIEKAGGIYIVARTFEQFYGWYQKTFY